MISSYHDGLREAVNFVQSKIIGILQGQINLSQQEKAVYSTFLRIFVLVNSLIRLNKKIDFNGVAIITRTIFELLLDIKTVSESAVSSQTLERFFAFSEIDRFRKAVRIVELQKEHPSLVDHSLLPSDIRKEYTEYPGRKAEIEYKVEKLWGKTRKGKLNWPDHWTGSSIRKVSESFGNLYEQEYLELYCYLSSYTHGGPSAVLGMSEEALECVYAVSLECSRKMFVESLVICSDTFNINKAIEKFDQVVTFLEKAPKEILVKKRMKELKYNNA